MIATQSIKSRYDAASPTYEADAPSSVEERLYWHVYEHLTWSAVEKLLPPAGERLRVLDAGGGGGKYGVLFAERGHHVTVLDISPGMLDRARASLAERGLAESADYLVGDVLSLPLPDTSFDLVFCEGDPISYCLHEHPRALAELFRVARPGAPIVLGVDNRYAHFLGALKGGAAERALPILRTGESLCPYGLSVHAFTVEEIRAAVTASGAEVVEVFGKPVLFFQVLEALRAERGPGFDPWQSREEIVALFERLAHESYASLGGHLQVMARRPRGGA